MVHKLDMNNFDTEILKSEIPVLVDFYADWCGPCKMMAPIMEALSDQMDSNKIKFAKINIDDNSSIAATYRVMSIPTFILFKEGKPIANYMGAMSQYELRDKLEQVLA